MGDPVTYFVTIDCWGVDRFGYEPALKEMGTFIRSFWQFGKHLVRNCALLHE
jgi:hypothetical protein